MASRDLISEERVLEFARREVGDVVGPKCRARFYFAGGAFKTLLTRRCPHDFDVWAPTPEDRAHLIDALLQHGAKQAGSSRFGERYAAGRRVIEVPFRTASPTLESRLARFDIGLSAIGAEHANGAWRCVVHPLARQSIRRGEILLLKPLVNWRYALATLERARRYADELGFTVPPSEESVVWDIFSSADAETRRGMVERFEEVTRGGFGVGRDVRRIIASLGVPVE